MEGTSSRSLSPLQLYLAFREVTQLTCPQCALGFMGPFCSSTWADLSS